MKQAIKNLATAMTALLLGVVGMTAQTYTHTYPKAVEKAASRWVKQGSWKGTFTKAVPAPTVNATEFCIQYNRNPNQWNALFAWLQANDLKALAPGRIAIGTTGLTASVEDGTNWCSESDLKNGKGSESHREKIDFMMVVDGVEGFALLDHDSSEPIGDYRPDVEHYRFDAARLKRFESIPGTFNIMFPCDWHVAKVKTGKVGEHVKVIVVKMDYVR